MQGSQNSDSHLFTVICKRLTEPREARPTHSHTRGAQGTGETRPSPSQTDSQNAEKLVPLIITYKGLAEPRETCSITIIHEGLTTWRSSSYSVINEGLTEPRETCPTQSNTRCSQNPDRETCPITVSQEGLTESRETCTITFTHKGLRILRSSSHSVTVEGFKEL